jgi:peptide chain release factor 1
LAGLEKIKDKTLEYFSTLEQIEENKLLLEDEELGELAKEELKTLEYMYKKEQEEETDNRGGGEEGRYDR